MDAQRASGADLFVDLGGKRRRFARLSMRQVANLLAELPLSDESERSYLSVFDLQRWAKTPEGCVAVIATSTDIGRDTVASWGSLVSRAAVAGLVVAESALDGEEVAQPEGEQRRPPQRAGTTQTKRSRSLVSRLGSAIRGRSHQPHG